MIYTRFFVLTITVEKNKDKARSWHQTWDLPQAFSKGLMLIGSAHQLKGGLDLRRSFWFRFDRGSFGLVMTVVDCSSQRDWHDTEGFGLEELHCGPNVFFHKPRYLSFCAIIWPLLPHLLRGPAFTRIPLRLLELGIRKNTSIKLRPHLRKGRSSCQACHSTV